MNYFNPGVKNLWHYSEDQQYDGPESEGAIRMLSTVAAGSLDYRKIRALEDGFESCRRLGLFLSNLVPK